MKMKTKMSIFGWKIVVFLVLVFIEVVFREINLITFFGAKTTTLDSMNPEYQYTLHTNRSIFVFFFFLWTTNAKNVYIVKCQNNKNRLLMKIWERCTSPPSAKKKKNREKETKLPLIVRTCNENIDRKIEWGLTILTNQIQSWNWSFNHKIHKR